MRRNVSSVLSLKLPINVESMSAFLIAGSHCYLLCQVDWRSAAAAEYEVSIVRLLSVHLFRANVPLNSIFLPSSSFRGCGGMIIHPSPSSLGATSVWIDRMRFRTLLVPTVL